jgi:hypothetical protein
MKRVLLVLLSSTVGCSHVHSVHQDTLESTPGVAIEEVGEKRVWFNFNFDNDFVTETYQRLLAKCDGGRIHSVSSRLSSENGFFFWYSRVRFAGICVKDQPPGALPRTIVAPASAFGRQSGGGRI